MALFNSQLLLQSTWINILYYLWFLFLYSLISRYTKKENSPQKARTQIMVYSGVISCINVDFKHIIRASPLILSPLIKLKRP